MEKIILVLGLVALLGGAYYLLNQETEQQSFGATAIEPQVVDLYQDWKKKYNKKYASPDQDWYRLTVFNDNYNTIKNFYEGPEQTYTLDFNQFMDISTSEFTETYLSTKVPTQRLSTQHVMTNDTPNAIDWRDKGVINAVKNQASCGSCWAFSAVGAMEPAFALGGKGLPNLSEQELVDCSQAYGNYGCNGGWMDSAFQYVIDHGISTQTAYPYVGRDQTCKRQDATYKITGFTDIAANDCASLENAAGQRPLSVAVDASNWQFYSGGVFSNCSKNLNHGVTLVAFDEGKWVIRNSWSSTWGEKGHISLAKGNTCGICAVASYPTL